MEIEDEIGVIGTFDSDGILIPHPSVSADWLWKKGIEIAYKYSFEFNGYSESESFGPEDRIRILGMEVIRLMRSAHRYHEQIFHEPYQSILLKNKNY